ncbi:MAG: efflux RND transporter periplasmic adaptor subunit [Thermoanaerobaculia bacterium]|nr:MAG: efflux RND transporter periplasmic adaptor subunit [Thermoanaerobaculia bacterium]MBZ0100875.1 efflux RND transporter periplasmic adaptor subunit [Thermoanaerobaculia bacterium]
MSKRTKWIVGGLAAVVLAGSGLALTGRGRDEGQVEVQVEPVATRQIVQTVEATGRVQPVTQVNISADVSAKITRLEVQEGEWVEKGQLLLELDRERYLAEVESAEANLRSSQAQARVVEENLSKVRKDLERVRSLFAQQLESQAALDAAEATAEVELARHRSALDGVEQSRAALKQVRDALSKTTIYAPMSGTVSKLNKEIGEIALGSQFQEDVILELSNLAGMEALVDVDENDIVRVSVGDRATIEIDALPGVTFEGEVTEIANSAKVGGAGTTEQKTEFEVKIAILDAGTQLRPGMTAAAEITTDVREEAIGVPIQSVAVRAPDQILAPGPQPEGVADAKERFPADKDGFAQIVFVVEDGVARARPVKTGIQSDTHIELIEGLAAGEQVVVGSYRAISRDLKDGTAVTVGDGKPAGDQG